MNTDTQMPESKLEPWPIDPEHGRVTGPGFLGDSFHSLRVRELFRYYQPPTQNELHHVAPINTGNDFVREAGLISAVDPILAALANLTARTMDMRRCIVTMTGAGTSYVIAESTRSLSLTYPHTHDPEDALMLGGGTATTSVAGLCEHTCSLLPPPPESNEPFLLEIPDLSRHPKFHDVGYVRNWPHGRFYCGAPLRTKNGVTIGTVCVLDDRTRYGGLTDKERLNMSNMADLFMQYLETKEGSRFRKKGQMMEMELSRFISEGFLPPEGSGVVERRNGRLWSENILQVKREQEEARRKKVLEKRQTLQEMEYAKMVQKEREAQQARVAHDGSQSPGGTETGTDESASPKPTSTTCSQPSIADSGTLLAPPEDYVPIVHPQQPGFIETVPRSIAEEKSSLLATVAKPLPMRSAPKKPTDTFDKSEESGTRAWFSGALSKEPEAALPTMRQLESVPFPTTVRGPDTDVSSSIPVTVGGSTGLPESTTATSLQSLSTQTKRSKYEESMSMEPHLRTMFSRAATVIKNTLQADVVFVNVDLEGFFEPETLEDVPYPGDVDWPQSSKDEDAGSKPRSTKLKPHRQQPGVLGYATSTGSSAVRFDGPRKANLGFDVSALRDGNLKFLLQDCKGGKIISFFDQYPGLEEHEDPVEVEYRKMLQAFLPKCRSVIIMPLHDQNHVLSSVCFAWTCSDQKTFYGDDEGRFVAGIATALEEEMTRLQIISADKAKSDFISSISHELRSPLHGILASGEFLIESELRMDQRSFVETIISCGTTLLDTVNHVLDFQKLNFLKDEHIERIEAPPSPERELSSGTEDQTVSVASSTDSEASLFQARSVDADFSAIVQEVTEGVVLGYEFKDVGKLMGCNTQTFEVASKVSKLQVVVDIDEFEGGWVFRSNPAAMKRIVVNLVGNAIKYSNETGWIRVSLSAKKIAPANNGAPRAKVSLVVSDSGKGIGREFLKTKLFTPFTQENPMAPGAGLGLSIVRQLVGVLNGKIDVKSQLGKGTTIRIELKATQSTKETPTKSALRESLTVSSLSGRKALFIGFERLATPETAKERGEALLYDSIKRYAQDLLRVNVVADLNAPNASECEIIIANELNALTQLHSLPTAKDCPVVVLSNNTPRRSVIEKLNLDRSRHLFAFVRKPCGPKKLFRAARFCLGVLEHGVPLKTPLPSAMEDDSCHGDHTPSYFSPEQDASKPTHPPLQSCEKTEQPINKHIELPTPSQDIVMSPVISTVVPHTPDLKATALESVSRTEASSVEAKPAPGPPNILCVEDNRINMMLITTYMKKRKYPFKTACDGLEAVERVKEKAEQGQGGFDCILMDLQMPVMDGLDSTREIRALEKRHPTQYPRSFIIALTGLATESDRADAFDAGIDAFMVKPVSFKDLEKLLQEQVRKEVSAAADGARDTVGIVEVESTRGKNIEVKTRVVTSPT